MVGTLVSPRLNALIQMFEMISELGESFRIEFSEIPNDDRSSLRCLVRTCRLADRPPLVPYSNLEMFPAAISKPCIAYQVGAWSWVRCEARCEFAWLSRSMEINAYLHCFATSLWNVLSIIRSVMPSLLTAVVGALVGWLERDTLVASLAPDSILAAVQMKADHSCGGIDFGLLPKLADLPVAPLLATLRRFLLP